MALISIETSIVFLKRWGGFNQKQRMRILFIIDIWLLLLKVRQTKEAVAGEALSATPAVLSPVLQLASAPGRGPCMAPVSRTRGSAAAGPR